MDVTNSIPQVRSVSLDEAAMLLGVSRRTVQRRLNDGTYTGHKRAGRWLVDVPTNAVGDASGEEVQARQVTLDEAAALLGVSRRTVQRRLNNGTLTGRKLAGRWLVNVPSAPTETRAAQIAATLSHQVEMLTRERDAQRVSLRELTQRVQRLEANRDATSVPVDDEAEVIEAVLATLTAWNGGDVDAFLSHFHPDANGFFLDGELLKAEMDKDALEIAYDAGFRPRITVQHVEVKVHDGSAVVTGYFVGTLAIPDDADMAGTWRYSEVRLKDEGRWKVLHYHLSPFTPEFVRRSP